MTNDRFLRFADEEINIPAEREWIARNMLDR